MKAKPNVKPLNGTGAIFRASRSKIAPVPFSSLLQKRERFRHPSCSTSGRLLAFLELLDDPSANWMDVVAGLEFDEPVSGWAAAKLNRALGSPCKPPDLNKVASFWMSKLKEHGIDPMSPISIRSR